MRVMHARRSFYNLAGRFRNANAKRIPNPFLIFDIWMDDRVRIVGVGRKWMKFWPAYFAVSDSNQAQKINGLVREHA